MPNSITPTKRSPQDDNKSTGNKSRNQSDNNPITATPAEWPRPQRIPGTQARSGRRTANGAMAVRWSGPDHTWMMPAINPVMAAIINLLSAKLPESCFQRKGNFATPILLLQYPTYKRTRPHAD